MEKFCRLSGNCETFPFYSDRFKNIGPDLNGDSIESVQMSLEKEGN